MATRGRGILKKSDQRGFTRRHAGPKAEARSVAVKVPLKWVWENDPQELPDDDHARCIAAPGERLSPAAGSCSHSRRALMPASRRRDARRPSRHCRWSISASTGRVASRSSTGAVTRSTAGRLPARPNRLPASPCWRLWRVRWRRARRSARVFVIVAGRIRRPEAATATARMAPSPTRSTRAPPRAATLHGRPRRRSPLAGTPRLGTGRAALLERGSSGRTATCDRRYRVPARSCDEQKCAGL